MKRFIASLLGIVMTAPTLFMTPSAAVADSVTGPWVWTDVSNQLTTRTNRPIWAVAYGNGSWFYTDGQDLWNGGQVYRYDGSSQVNITTDVRNAGLNRVDDIVSDGSTILFLQDVVRTDNQLSVVTYRNGQYLNITSQVRSVLQSDEGISSINGRAGTWMVVTTKARVLRLTNTGVATQISLPVALNNRIEGTPTTMRYNVNHGSMVNGAGRLPLAVVPISNNDWLFVADPDNSSVRFYRFNESSFTDITDLLHIPAERVTKIATNGEQALVMGDGSNGSWARLVNGVNAAEVTQLNGTLNDTRVFWNGKEWMILQNKEMYRVFGSFTNQAAVYMNRTRDLFLTGAGDNNGRFLLGGVQSDAWTSDPTSPLTAKLVMVTEGVPAPRVAGATDTGGDRVYTSTFGPRITVQGNPSDFRIGDGREFTYRVLATDPNGVNRIDLYVNDALIRTCLSQDTCEFRTNYWTNGASTRSVKFWTRATDTLGNVTDTSGNPDYLTVDRHSGSVNGATDTIGSIWTWLEPNQTTLHANQSVAFRVNANDTNGLSRIEILANGATVRTCTLNGATGNQACDYTVYANNYAQGSNVFVNAKAVDQNGNTVWSNGTTFFRGNDNVNPPSATNGTAPDVWDWLDGNDNTLTGTEFVEYRVGAWDEDGMDRIEIVVNGAVRNTCTFNASVVSRECTFRLYADSYSAGTDVFVNAKATDRSGQQTWTDGETIHIGSSNGTSQNGNGSVSITANKSSYVYGDSVTFTANGYDPDGTDRVEIYLNAVRVKTCAGSGTCRVTLGPLTGISVMTYAATVFGTDGTRTTTGYKQLYRR